MSGLMLNSAPKLRQIRSYLANAMLFGCLACGTLASAALPFYVHFNPDKFGPPLMHFSGDLDRRLLSAEEIVPQRERQVASVLRPKLQIDQIITGSISGGVSTPLRKVLPARPYPEQPFPDRPRVEQLDLQVLFVSQNRAMVFDGRNVEVLRTGSRLPDGSRVEAISKRNDLWTIKMSTGATYAWSPRN